ncbi:hypothetical protein [Erwinia sorbitola]|jgi:hypothetical protein|uniref:Uncharacterized protein n=1 Tax=Erwinia sorbitola TaxID=2681984 RepID=A0A6I6ELL3_9GAMM|nr:hypothetical protein [Erwinia sorbitola]MTD28229.1 hypothetical protein [Erwinia sorbitola]QGU85919.1 hypothetical protein GN242_01170 [Erwinia sorbitola]
MKKNNRRLSIVLLEDIPFDKLIPKLEKAFSIKLPYKDDKGRDIARATMEGYSLEVVDRIDRLGDFLCDDFHILYIILNSEDDFNSSFEDSISKNLKEGNIKWKYATWSRLSESEDWRRIFPS